MKEKGKGNRSERTELDQEVQRNQELIEPAREYVTT